MIKKQELNKNITDIAEDMKNDAEFDLKNTFDEIKTQMIASKINILQHLNEELENTSPISPNTHNKLTEIHDELLCEILIEIKNEIQSDLNAIKKTLGASTLHTIHFDESVLGSSKTSKQNMKKIYEELELKIEKLSENEKLKIFISLDNIGKNIKINNAMRHNNPWMASPQGSGSSIRKMDAYIEKLREKIKKSGRFFNKKQALDNILQSAKNISPNKNIVQTHELAANKSLDAIKKLAAYFEGMDINNDTIRLNIERMIDELHAANMTIESTKKIDVTKLILPVANFLRLIADVVVLCSIDLPLTLLHTIKSATLLALQTIPLVVYITYFIIQASSLLFYKDTQSATKLAQLLDSTKEIFSECINSKNFTSLNAFDNALLAFSKKVATTVFSNRLSNSPEKTAGLFAQHPRKKPEERTTSARTIWQKTR